LTELNCYHLSWMEDLTGEDGFHRIQFLFMSLLIPFRLFDPWMDWVNLILLAIQKSLKWHLSFPVVNQREDMLLLQMIIKD